MKLHLIFLFQLFLVELISSTPVNVDLQARWLETSFLAESSEYVAQTGEPAFWEFISIVQKHHQSVPTSMSQKDDFDFALSCGKELLGDDKLLRSYITLRPLSPRVEMHRKMSVRVWATHPKNPHEEASYDREECKFNIPYEISLAPCKGSTIWATVGSNEIACNVEDIKSLVEKEPLHKETFTNKLYDFDHIFGDEDSEFPVVVLYCDVKNPNFVPWHSELTSLADAKKLTYALRHFDDTIYAQRIPSRCPIMPLKLAGYGVELAVRKSEYNLRDDSNKGTENDEGENEVSPELTKEEVENLGFTATQYVLNMGNFSDAMDALAEVSLDFPTVAPKLARMKVDRSLLNVYDSVHQNAVESGSNMMLVNGRSYHNLEEVNIFSLLNDIRLEVELATKLRNLKMDDSSLLSLPKVIYDSKQAYASNPRRFRVKSAVDHVLWLNDVENDKRFQQLPRHVRGLLRPTYPGQLAPVRKNVFNIIFVMDPLEESASYISSAVKKYIEQGAIIRFGFLFKTASENEEMDHETETYGIDDDTLNVDYISEDPKSSSRIRASIAKSCIQIMKTRGFKNALEFMVAASASYHNFDFKAENVEEFMKKLTNLYLHHGADGLLSSLPSFSDAMKNGQDQIMGGNSFLKKSGLTSAGPCLLFNGALHQGGHAIDQIPREIWNEFTFVKGLVSTRKLLDSDTDPHSVITESSENSFSVYSFIAMRDERKPMPAFHANALPFKTTSTVPYIPPYDDDLIHSVTIWVACDLATPEGSHISQQLLKFQASKQGDDVLPSRVALIHVGSDVVSRTLGVAWDTALIMKTKSKEKLNILNIIAKIGQIQQRSDMISTLLRDLEVVNSKVGKKVAQIINSEITESQFSVHLETSKTLSLTQGSIVVNGGLIKLTSSEIWKLAWTDFEALAVIEHKRFGGAMLDAIDTVSFHDVASDELTSAMLSDVCMFSIAILAPNSDTNRKTLPPSLKGFDEIRISNSQEGRKSSAIRVEACLNPLSTVAQRLIPLVKMLSNSLHADVSLYLNPVNKKFRRTMNAPKDDEKVELPLKKFYRSVLPEHPQFDENGCLSAYAYSVFEGLPLRDTLTLGLDVPESWILEAIKAPVDLDNIRMESMTKSSLDVSFELIYMVVTGQCYDDEFTPPRGLQLEIGSRTRAGEIVPHQDTLVMSNLGYFQLKCTPGLWELQIAKGHHSEVYALEKSLPGVVDNSLLVPLDTFLTTVVQLRVKKRPGMQDVQLTENPEEKTEPTQKDSSIWDSMVGSSVPVPKKETEINILSLVSGHLYERLVRIMMISVMRNTKAPVTFWFMQEYLSPQFKKAMPCMAKQYGFSYRYISYKWPSWLNKQTEKMRTIWAMKALFLDVLFPLNTSKIIIVDADQIIRTDMLDLMNLDLEGKPLGYTPFCSDKKEMDGFRFWNSGFWKGHLQGKPYHISALYVVDLVKFRQMSAGDIFRITYEQLSKDPNSLSNLDQDLPNYLQNRVPIFSLPQEWLWCESWCSLDSLSKAKTVDLCNNPLTKRNKLEVAREVVEEWPELDREAAGLVAKDGPCYIGENEE